MGRGWGGRGMGEGGGGEDGKVEPTTICKQIGYNNHYVQGLPNQLIY